MIKDSFKKLSYIIFPRRCELCGEVVYPTVARCSSCKSLKRINGELCDICGCQKDECQCKGSKSKMEYKKIIAPYYYDSSIISGIHRLKLYGFNELSEAMAFEISKAVNEKYNDISFDLVTYVPMSKKRLRKRGYNQSKLLAEYVSKYNNIALSNALIKTRETSPQRGKTAKQRKMNLRGSFDLNGDYSLVEDKVILLVDDVKTTGATLSECAYVLNGYGAKAVYCATVAVVKRG